jgi:hypothetical protein
MHDLRDLEDELPKFHTPVKTYPYKPQKGRDFFEARKISNLSKTIHKGSFAGRFTPQTT